MRIDTTPPLLAGACVDRRPPHGAIRATQQVRPRSHLLHVVMTLG